MNKKLEDKKFTRGEILAMKPGLELDALYNKVIMGVEYEHHELMPHYSTSKLFLVNMLNEPSKPDDYFGVGLFVAPLNNDQWVCGRGNKIYDIKITDDHFQDKGLVICDTPMEAACKMRLILAICPEEAVNR